MSVNVSILAFFPHLTPSCLVYLFSERQCRQQKRAPGVQQQRRQRRLEEEQQWVLLVVVVIVVLLVPLVLPLQLFSSYM
jgi:ABC-type Fe3+ transport system permease subunit